jgi:predicted Zn-dependent protease
MQKKFLPIALGTLLGAFFAANSAQAELLNSNGLQATHGTPIAYNAQLGAASGQHYMAQVTEMGHLIWPLDRMPLKVFIEDGSGTEGFRDYYPDFMRKAFNEWQNTSNGKISWREVSSPQQADIVCTWTSNAKPKGPGVEAGETKSTIGVNRLTGQQNIIRANISVLTSLMGRSFSDTDTYKTCLHEVGHAIGMEGHSNTQSDIMYPVLNSAQTPYLKERDINTIAALYSESNQPRYVAQAQQFQPQYGRNFMPGRQYQQPWQGRQMNDQYANSDDDGAPPMAFQPQGRFRSAPININELSYSQREALMRAIRRDMQRRAYMRGSR